MRQLVEIRQVLAVESKLPGLWVLVFGSVATASFASSRKGSVMSDAQHASDETGIASTVNADLPPENVGSVIGPYKLLQQIGQGGFGVVYMAEQEKPVRRVVALKIIKPGMDTGQVIARFESERQALALMDHPNIAKVLDAGATASGHPYFVMELVRGVPITEFCDKNHLRLEARLNLFVDVCDAIQHAHHKGIIHRDIKSSNVMVTLHDGVPVVKIIDFGVAKATVQKLTERTLFTAYGQMVGTPEYMSPEQAEMSGLDIDTRSDVYSLGVLLYELLTGTTPLEANRLREAGYANMQKLIQEEEPPRPSARLSSLGDTATVIAHNRGLDVKRLTQLLEGDLDWVVMKSLEKDRNRRYPTPGAFAEDIQRYLAHEAVAARPPSTSYRLKKFAQRNQTVVLTAAVVAISLLAGTAVSVWQALRATQAETAALASAESANAAAAVAVFATKAEQKAKDDALARNAETKAVLKFVENHIFAAARPQRQEGGLGRDVTLRKAIESALSFVEKSFAKQPVIEARLRLTLGQSFYLLGDSQTASEQAERARALFARELGPDHEDTLASMNNLADSYFILGRLTDALKLHEETLALRRGKLGPHHPDTLTSMSNLANSYYALGRRAEALKLRQETLALRKATLGPNDIDTLRSMNNLAISYRTAGRYSEAFALVEDATARRKATFGPEHPDTLRSIDSLAVCLYNVGHYAEAIKVTEEALPSFKAEFGPDHHITLAVMGNLALYYGSTGRYADAVRLGEETVALHKTALGLNDPYTLLYMSNLAGYYWILGRDADALTLRKETLALRVAKLGANHPDTLKSMSYLAESYDAVGRYAEALKLNEETLGLRKANLGPRDPDTLKSMSACAHSLVALHRGSEAVPISRQAAELWENLNRTDPFNLCYSARFRAVAAEAIRAADKASPAAQQADAEADRAMAWLKKAVDAGYMDTAELKRDKYMDPLRNRDDFKKLVADLEQKSRDKVKP